ncbi:MAG TPA: hypothetical protein DEW22_02485 [Clostridiales bacterium]|nr:hypothetical protein [Clostridiales bacterium]
MMRTEDKDYVEAVKGLASFADIDTVENNSVESSNLMRDAAFYYHSQLRNNPKAKTAIDLLHSWGIQGKTIVQLGIGFHDDSFNSFMSYMTKKKSYSAEALEEANLAIKSSKGTLFDKMRNSIIIPTIDRDGKVGFKFESTLFFKCLNKSIELFAKLGFREFHLGWMKESRFLERSSVVQQSVRNSDEIIVVAAFFDVSHNSLLK